MGQQSNKRLIIVDISSFIFRAFHAIRPLNAPDGTPVNAVSGVLSMLLKLMSDYRPNHLILARDTRGGSFRNELYDQYKANRSEPPDELIPQFPLIDQLIEKLKIPSCQMPKFEADDIIGSLVTQWAGHFDEILIASGDKDLMQFVNEKVRMLDTQKDIIYGPQEVFDKMGVWPNQIVDYLSIIGDSSDNVPGMKGIGAVGAAKLLAQYQTFDQIVAHRHELTGKKTIEAFEHYLADGELSRSLIQIPTNLSLPLSVEQSRFSFAPDQDLINFLQNLGFRSAVTRMQQLMESEERHAFEQSKQVESSFELQTAPIPSLQFEHRILKANEQQSFLELISTQPSAAFYLAFSSDEVVDKSLVALSICWDDATVWTLPFGMTPFSGFENLSLEFLQQLMQAVLARDNFEFIGYDIKSSYHLWPWIDRWESPNYFDVLQAHFVSAPDDSHSLAYMATQAQIHGFENAVKGQSLSDGQAQDLLQQVALPAAILWKLAPGLKKKLQDLDLWSLYLKIDQPLIPVLGRMERHGICLNPPYLKKLEIELAQEIANIEDEVNKMANEPINLRSPKQVGHLLFEVLGLPALKKTKTGYSTSAEVLEALQEEHPHAVLDLLMRFREIDKIQSTYVAALPQLLSAKTARIHTHFNTHIAATGRLSSTNPNLQNIPVRSETGKKVRKAFIATRGRILLSADYSQVELRLLAHFAQDPIMLKAFAANEDIHAQTAAEILQIPLTQVTSEQRRQAKTVNFGLMYGQSSFGLAKTLGIGRAEAFDYITRYFNRFAAVKSFLDRLKEQCEQTGETVTLHGRKRFLPDIHSTNRTIKSMAEREAINTPIQGTAADIIKLAMISIDREFKQRQLKSQMLLQVHDELIFDVVEEELEEIKSIVIRQMENSVQLSVPLRVETGIGVNWYDLK